MGKKVMVSVLGVGKRYFSVHTWARQRPMQILLC